MRKSLLFLLVLTACTEGVWYSSYQPIDNGGWRKDEVKEFSFSPVDSIQNYHMYIHIRNDDTFPYSNLFLITEMTFPGGEQMKDTLEYIMAEPSGRWLGEGVGSIKENKLWYRENIVFPVKGVYTLRITHAMRQNGEVDGIDKLLGITDVGIEIEQAQ